MDTIQSLSLIDQVPPHDRSLSYCRSMKRRRRVRFNSSISVGDVARLKSWFASKEFSVVIGEACGLKTSSRDFAVDLVDTLLEAKIPVIWILPSSLDEGEMTVEHLLVTLIMQALKMNSGVLSEHVNPVSATHFKETRSVKDWFRILQRCLNHFKECVIVLDLILISKVLQKDSPIGLGNFMEMLEDFSRNLRTTVKIVTLTWRSDATLYGLSECLSESLTVTTDPGPRKIRLMRKPKYRAAFSARGNRLSTVFKGENENRSVV